MCFSTVPPVTKRRREMPALERPSAIRVSTWRSRAEKRGKRVLAPARGHQLPNQRRVHDRAAPGDPLQRVQELFHIGDAALEQVADAISASQQLHRVLDLSVSGQHQDGGIWQFLTDHPGRLQPLSRVGGRHPDVGHYQVRPGLPGQRKQPRAVTRLPHYLIAGTAEQPGQALAQQDIVLGQHHPRPSHDGARPVPSGSTRPVPPLLIMLCIIDQPWPGRMAGTPGSGRCAAQAAI